MSLSRSLVLAAPLLLVACGEVRVDPLDAASGAASSTGAGGSSSAASTGTTTSAGAGGGEACPATTWVKRFGAELDQRALAVAVDPACNLILAAAITDTVDYGNGPLHGKFYQGTTLAKLAPDGHAIWSRWLESTKGTVGISAIVADPGGNILLAGVFGGTFDFGDGPLVAGEHGSAYIAMLDPQGAPLWTRLLTAGLGIDGPMLHLHRGADGTLLVTGSFLGVIDLGDGPIDSFGEDMFVLRLDAEGHTLWSKRFGGPGNTLDQVASADLASDGTIALTGSYEGALDLGTGPLPWLWNGVFVASLDAAGNARWSASLPEAACGYGDCLNRVAQDADGALTVFGSRLSDPALPDQAPGLFERVFDAGGALTASHDLDGRWIQGLARTASGAWLLAGQLGDGAVARVEEPSSTTWNDGHLSAENLGDRLAGAQVIAIDPGGNLVVAGAFHGTLDLAGTTLGSAGKHDLFVARLPLP